MPRQRSALRCPGKVDRSIVSDNIRQVLAYINWDYSMINPHMSTADVRQRIFRVYNHRCSTVELATVSLIKELCLQREGFVIPSLLPHEVTDLLYNICTV